MNKTVEDIAAPVRQALDQVLPKMRADDVRAALHLVDALLQGGKAMAGSVPAPDIVADPAASSALKLIGFFVRRCGRGWANRPLAESVSALKDLLWLRGRLRMLVLAQAPAAAREAPAAAGDGPDAQPPDAARGDPVADGIVLVYQLCVGRTPGRQEIDNWARHIEGGMSFVSFLRGMHGSAEATERRAGQLPLASVPDGQFIQLVYEAVLGRGCSPRELAVWEKQMASGWMGREAILLSLFNDAAGALQARPDAAAPAHDGLSCHIMGTGRQLSRADWDARARELRSAGDAAPAERLPHARFHIRQEPKVLVSAIASLYRGGRYIERFMENITSQSCFRDYGELIIVDADSP